MKDSSATTYDEVLVSKAFLADPYPVLHQLREEDPVHWSESIGGWVLTKYDDIIITFKETDRYSNEGRLARAIEYLPAESKALLRTFEDHYRTKGLLHSRSAGSYALTKAGDQGLYTTPDRGHAAENPGHRERATGRRSA